MSVINEYHFLGDNPTADLFLRIIHLHEYYESRFHCMYTGFQPLDFMESKLVKKKKNIAAICKRFSFSTSRYCNIDQYRSLLSSYGPVRNYSKHSNIMKKRLLSK
jgi:hypothetical protein